MQLKWLHAANAEQCACNSLPIQIHCLANKVQALLGLLLRSPGQEVCQEGWHQQVLEVCSAKTGVHARLRGEGQVMTARCRPACLRTAQVRQSSQRHCQAECSPLAM